MKKSLLFILVVALGARFARADTQLTVGDVGTVAGAGPCWQDESVIPGFGGTSSFTLPAVTGTGSLFSSVFEAVNFIGPTQPRTVYTYSVDTSSMSAPSFHCIKLIIHFGAPITCAYDVMVFTNGNTGLEDIGTAWKAPLGDVTIYFHGNCLVPGHKSLAFGMVSDKKPKNGSVTLIDEYINPANGETNVSVTSVGAVVPDIPPNWAYAPEPLPNIFFQGSLVTNSAPGLPTNSGPYDFTLQLLDAPSNGLPVGQVFTQTVQLRNSLFTMPLPFDPDSFSGGNRWLSLAARPSSVPAVQFSPLTPPLPIAPAPQAFYAFSAGVVADLSPGQAVTSLDGLKDAVSLQAGAGMLIETNGNTLIVSAQPGVPSDRNVKTDFAAVNPSDMLARLATLPVQSWRYTNEIAGVRHVGPMAQDFRQIFGLGSDNNFIAFVDEQGVALAAIQGLNRKLDALQKELDRKSDENAELKQELSELRQLISQLKNQEKQP